MSGIKRFFNGKHFDVIKKDLGFLIKAVNESHGELDFQIRPGNRINIYYKGNSLADISFNKGFYQIKVHERFKLEDAANNNPLKRFSGYSFVEKDKYVTAQVERELIHPFLQKSTLNSLMSKIKKVNNGEEISFEQSLMSDNLNRPEYIIIDRQVGGGGVPGMLDLLALRRMSPGKYQLEAVEVKLGNNKELCKAVFGQINKYVEAIVKNQPAFKFCYERNYAQKKALGLFPEDWDDEIEILDKVSGKIVVGSYGLIGEKYIKKLQENYPNMPYDIQPFTNIID